MSINTDWEELLEEILSYLEDPQVNEALMQMLKVIGVAVAVVAGIALLVGLVVYIFRSISLYTIAKRRGCKLYGFAWVPGLWVWTLGGIADTYDAKRGRDLKWRHVLLWISVAIIVFGDIAGALNVSQSVKEIQYNGNTDQLANYAGQIVVTLVKSIGFTGLLVALRAALKVLKWICYGKLFESCSEHPVVLILLMILIPISLPVMLLVIRKKDAGMAVKLPAEAAESV